MDLEDKLEEVEREYRAGELTDVGFRRRKVKIQKEILKRDFDQGELTEEGYARKMARLEDPPSICKELSEPNLSVKDKIKELFGRGSSKHCQLPKPKQLPKKKITKQSTTVTVVCVDKNTFATPTRKGRNILVEGGKIKEMAVRHSEDESSIMEKLQKLFPSFTSFSLLKETSSKDLIPASLATTKDDAFGAALLKLTDGHDLYVVGSVNHSPSQQHTVQVSQQTSPPSSLPLQQQRTVQVGQQTCPPSSLPLQQQRTGQVGQQTSPPSSLTVQQNIGSVNQQTSPTPTSLLVQQQVGDVHQFHVRPKSKVFATVISVDSSQVEFNKDVLSEQLYDKRLYEFWRDHSLIYHPSAAERMMDTEDSNLCINEQEPVPMDSTLLYVDSQVMQWIQWRDHHGRPHLTEHRDQEYVQVTMEEMDEFYAFKRSHFVPGTVQLPSVELLNYYVYTEKKTFPVMIRYGKEYVVMTSQEVDQFIEWIEYTRENTPTFAM